MKTAKIDFTEQEAQAALNIIHIAVRAAGLEDGGTTAKNGAYLFEKIKSAFPAEAKEETPKEIRDKVYKKK